MDLQVLPYIPEYRAIWNEFVRKSKNGTFLFDRNFMEYHADRFVDASLLIRNDDKLLAILPASSHNTPNGCEVRSHGGLTYGGLVCDSRMSAAAMLEVMATVISYYQTCGIKSLVYKAVPHIYHSMPAEEDLYALFRNGAQLKRRDVATVLEMGSRAPITKGRRWAIKQGGGNGVQVSESSDWTGFMAMETALLQEKYGQKPVHDARELEALHRHFPEQVRLFTAVRDEELLAGTVVFDTPGCAHAQYISSTRTGRHLRALDVLFDWLLGDVFSDRRWFDFGISTEEEGRNLNAGLSSNKESWGARSVVYDQYLLGL